VTLVIVLILLAAAMLAPGLVIGPSLDAAVFNHVGGRLVDGVAPYVGTWDHKPPGMYLASAAAQALLGGLDPWAGDWLLSVASTVGIGVALAAALARLGVGGWPRLLSAAGALVFAGHYFLALGGGLTEPAATALVATALAMAVRPADRVFQAVAGSLVGLSLLVSPQVLPGAAAVIFLALARQPAGSRPAGAMRLAGGIALPIAAVAAWLFLIGALPAAFDAVITYSVAYRAASAGYGATLGVPVAAWTVLAALFLTMPAMLGAASLSSLAVPRRGAAVASLLWVVSTLLLIVLQGRFYAHYAIPLAVPLGILAGLGLERMGRTLGRASSPRVRALLLLPMIVAATISLVAGTLAAAIQIAPIADRSHRMQEVAERLRDLPAGALLVWGNQPRLYDLAGRAPATRYSYLYPLTTAGYSTAAMVDDVARGLAADPPAVVVDVGSNAPGQPGFLPLLIERPIATDGRDLDLLDPLRAFVAERYELAATVAGWPIYVLRTETAP
jgi:hypothetical protein